MKNIFNSAIVLLICTFIFFSSCEPKVLFQEAIPPEIDSINKIPEEFQGVFVCESDSSRLYVDAYKAYNESYHVFKTSIDKVKETENCSVIAGGLYLPGRKECIPFEYIGEDSIKAKVYSIDTLFSFRDDEILKIYKGRLFLNYKNGYNEWVSFMISPLEDGSFHWELIDVPDKISKVEAITNNYRIRYDYDDNRKFIIKPTLIEFDKIIEKEYTRDCDILTPLNIEVML